MKASLFTTLATLCALALTVPVSANAAGHLRAGAAIWAHGELYGTVGTPAVFTDPPPHSTDTLYNFGMSGLEGQRAVSAAAPGDPDFNGGRWSVVLVTFTDAGMALHDKDLDNVVDTELTSEEEVLEEASLGLLDLTYTSVYFECPLLPGANQ